jgi:hypothetical protein
VINEFRAMLIALGSGASKCSWDGAHFAGYKSPSNGQSVVWFRARENSTTFGFSAEEWASVGALFRRAWKMPEISTAWDALALEYSEL